MVNNLVSQISCSVAGRKFFLFLAFVFVLYPSLRPLGAQGAQAVVDFSREVRPILANHCFKCHGPDQKSRKGGLRLDIRKAALTNSKSGVSAIVPGLPEKSESIRRLFSDDPDEVMPPPSTKHEVSESEKEILKRWILQGAEYREHWAFEPVKPVQIPLVEGAEHPIDAFIGDRLLKEGLKPSPAADAGTVVRRLYLDLIGIPPTEEQVVAFGSAYREHPKRAVADAADQLLASPHYGERWARKWLDLARYADTNGYEKDRVRSIWPYRDWVIRAINEDLPFDQFTIQQLAGDMLPNATEDQRVATGFHRNTMINEEGGIDPLEFRFHAMTDRVATTGTTWMGLTFGCAQCHTHKYDPILHSEYYRLMAFMNNADEPELQLDPVYREQVVQQNADQLGRFLNEAPGQWPLPGEQPPDPKKPAAAPVIRTPEQMQAAKQNCDEAFRAWLSRERSGRVDWTVMRPVSAKSNLPLLTVQADGAVIASGDISKDDTYELVFEGLPAGVSALRLEALPDPSLPAQGPGMAYYEGPKGDFFMGEFRVFSETSGREGRVKRGISSASESFSGSAFGGRPSSAWLATDGDMQTGWSGAGRAGEAIHAVFVLENPLEAGARISVQMQFGRHYACPLGKFRFSCTTAPGGAQASAIHPDLQHLLALSEGQIKESEVSVLKEQFFLSSKEAPQIGERIRSLRRVPVLKTTLVLRERPVENPRPTFIHRRGEYLQPEERVQPGVPAFLPSMEPGTPQSRLGLALWLVSGKHPLTARVTVNRHWQAFFGNGLVRTLGDFGFQGEMPSHPELLDWLAGAFVREGWSLKKLHRLIVTSQTYAQSSRVSRELQERDPANRLLARGPRFRLDAEVVRDSVLAASGLLSSKMFGPPVYPPQPVGVQEGAYGGGSWPSSKGEDRYRRSIYTFLKRSAPFAMFNTFDAPSGEVCVARREQSNTPMQSLTLLNDEMFQEAARRLGCEIASLEGADRLKIACLFRRCLMRDPSEPEITRMEEFVVSQRARLQTGELDSNHLSSDDPSVSRFLKLPKLDRALWMVTARAVFNLDEFVTKN